MLTGWRRRLLWHCCWCSARRYISLISVLRISIDLMKENVFMLKNVRNRQYPVQTITDADYADDIALLANTPTQAETQLHRLDQAAGPISLHVNADETKYIYFNQNGEISTLNSGSLKLVDKFSYARNSVSSTENMRLAKVWSAIDCLSII